MLATEIYCPNSRANHSIRVQQVPLSFSFWPQPISYTRIACQARWKVYIKWEGCRLIDWSIVSKYHEPLTTLRWGCNWPCKQGNAGICQLDCGLHQSEKWSLHIQASKLSTRTASCCRVQRGSRTKPSVMQGFIPLLVPYPSTPPSWCSLLPSFILQHTPGRNVGDVMSPCRTLSVGQIG